MYRILLLISFLALTGWIYWLLKNNRINSNSPAETYKAFMSLIKFKEDKLRTLRIVSYQLTLFSFILLGLTAFLPILIIGGHLSGFPLILHVTVAPVFCVSLALSAVLWAHHHRLFATDWSNIKTKVVQRIFVLDQGTSSWQKIYFWLFLLISIPAILSIVLGMYPLFGTEGQAALLIIHSYSTFLLFILISLHTIGMMRISEKSEK